MKRSMFLAVAVLTTSLVPTAAFAAKPTYTCPASPAGFERVTVERWWERTVEGFETEGIPVYENDGITFTEVFNNFSADFGFGDGQGLKDFIFGPQWERINKNGDEGNVHVCMKSLPRTPGNPAYLFVGVDDNASVK